MKTYPPRTHRKKIALVIHDVQGHATASFANAMPKFVRHCYGGLPHLRASKPLRERKGEMLIGRNY